MVDSWSHYGWKTIADVWPEYKKKKEIKKIGRTNTYIDVCAHKSSWHTKRMAKKKRDDNNNNNNHTYNNYKKNEK